MTETEFERGTPFYIVDEGVTYTGQYRGEYDDVLINQGRTRKYYPVTFRNTDGIRAQSTPSLFNRKIKQKIVWFFTDMKII